MSRSTNKKGAEKYPKEVVKKAKAALFGGRGSGYESVIIYIDNKGKLGYVSGRITNVVSK